MCCINWVIIRTRRVIYYYILKKKTIKPLKSVGYWDDDDRTEEVWQVHCCLTTQHNGLDQLSVTEIRSYKFHNDEEDYDGWHCANLVHSLFLRETFLSFPPNRRHRKDVPSNWGGFVVVIGFLPASILYAPASNLACPGVLHNQLDTRYCNNNATVNVSGEHFLFIPLILSKQDINDQSKQTYKVKSTFSRETS